MESFLAELKLFFERLDTIRDRALFVLIKPYWPRAITPNHLTFVRIAIGFILFVLLFYYKNTDRLLIVSLFFIGAFSDMLDGSIARGLAKETKLGIALDPIADRILIIPIALYSLLGPHRWLFLLLMLLEVANAFVSMYAQSRNITITSNIFGKVKMFLQSIVFLAILLFWPEPPNDFFVYLLWISMYLIIISIFFKIREIKNHGKN